MDAVLAKLDAIAAMVAELRAELAAYPNETTSDETANVSHGNHFADENLIETSDASARFNFPTDTIRKWCREDGCGTKRGGRWLADVACIQKRVKGL